PEGAVPFRQFRPVWSMDEWDVGHGRHCPPKRLIYLRLPRGVVEMIVAPNDVSYPHVMIVNHDGEHIGRRAVGTKQNKIIKILILPDDTTLDLIVYDCFSGHR